MALMTIKNVRSGVVGSEKNGGALEVRKENPCPTNRGKPISEKIPGSSGYFHLFPRISTSGVEKKQPTSNIQRQEKSAKKPGITPFYAFLRYFETVGSG